MTLTAEDIETIEAMISSAQVTTDADAHWIMFSGVLVFFMYVFCNSSNYFSIGSQGSQCFVQEVSGQKM